MRARRKLYGYKDLYNFKDTNELFYASMLENYRYELRWNRIYRQWVKRKHATYKNIKAYSELHKLPCLPTWLLKERKLKTTLYGVCFHATSSGTSGKKSHIYYDLGAILAGAKMMYRMIKFHRLWSICPTHYIMLGGKPSKENQTILSKTQFGCSLFTPAKSRTYGLKVTNKGEQVREKEIMELLERYEKGRRHRVWECPVRIIGMPSYLFFLVNTLREKGIQCQLPKGSKILLGGGWKQHYQEEVEKEVLFQLIEETLGVKQEACIEFFGIAEHPQVYCTCKNHHFHVPSYSRVIVRDVEDLTPLPYGEVGLMSFLSSLTIASPLLHIMTDDLGVMYSGEQCGCGIKTPYFDILGRVGMKQIKTCSATSEELVKKYDEIKRKNNHNLKKGTVGD